MNCSAKVLESPADAAASGGAVSVMHSITGAIILAALCAFPAKADEAVKPQVELRSGSTIVYNPSFFAAANPANALEMVKRLPAFDLKSDIKERGLGGARSNVLIDGEQPFTKAEDLEDLLERIPASDVLRIEIWRDGALSGPNAGAVVANIIRRPNGRSAVITVNASALKGGEDSKILLEGERRSGGSAYNGALTAYVERSNQPNGKYFRAETGRTPVVGARIKKSRSHGSKAQGKGAWTGTTRSGSFGLTAETYEDRSTDIVRLQLPDARLQDREIYQSHSSDKSYELAGDLKIGPTAGFDSIELIALQSYSRSKYDDFYTSGGSEDRSYSKTASSESVLRATASRNAGRNLSLQAGLELAYNRLEGRSAYQEGSLNILLPSQDVEVSEPRGEAFARARGQWGERWRFDAGVAFELSRITASGDGGGSSTFTHVKPDLSVSYVLSEAETFKFSIARNVSQLDFSDFLTSVSLQDELIDIGNPNLEPQRSTVTEFSYDLVFWKSGALNLKIGQEAIDNALDYVRLGPVLDAPGNLGYGRREYVGGSVTVPTDRWGVRGGVLSFSTELSRSRIRDPVTGKRRAISSESPFFASISFKQDLAGGRVSWGVDVYGSDASRSYRFRETQRSLVSPAIGAEIEYRFAHATSVRLRLESGVRTKSERRGYVGSRASGNLAFVQVRESRPQPGIYLRFRRRLS